MREICDCGKPTNKKQGYKLFGNFCSTACKEKFLKKIKPLLKTVNPELLKELKEIK